MAEHVIPRTLAEALDPAWLSAALAALTGGAPVTAVETVEVIRTVATKVRFTAAFEGAKAGKEAFCLKGFLDIDDSMTRGGFVETDFYAKLASQLPVRLPACVATVMNRETQQGIFIMRDLIDQGARFCTALEPFSANHAAQSLEQLARLHASRSLLDGHPWVRRRIAELAHMAYVTPSMLQEMLDGPRGEGLSSQTRNAALLLQGVRALAARDEANQPVLVHGDCHAGNIFWTADGPGLIDWQVLQQGGWALDVAYHIAAVLPIEVAETDERALLDHYIDAVRGFGGEALDRENAWTQYRMSAVYGYYLWAITRRVEPSIIKTFVGRLGASVARHGSFQLLGL
ncbi:MAG: aminoglycoside phosphotransferase family protein [Rhodospirillaceae bacterium]|nr:MAG: aminoglycoside phosphotransferase family protein [Rhodospirillaceae bacterium]